MKTYSSRLQRCFENNTPKLSPYITAGDIDKALTVPLMHQMVKAGADIIELGIPFSEPMAEGVTIQRAMERALNNGTKVADVFEMVAQFRQDDADTPVILMGYMNPIEIYGFKAFAQKAQQVGVDGTIIVDLPPEESQEILPIWHQHQLDPILLCSPTTSSERLSLIKQQASGYIYFVSLKGVTGSAAINIDNVHDQYQQFKTQLGEHPLLVGFGIKTADSAKQITRFADGIVIGAALIEAIYQSNDPLTACYDF